MPLVRCQAETETDTEVATTTTIEVAAIRAVAIITKMTTIKSLEATKIVLMKKSFVAAIK